MLIPSRRNGSDARRGQLRTLGEGILDSNIVNYINSAYSWITIRGAAGWGNLSAMIGCAHIAEGETGCWGERGLSLSLTHRNMAELWLAKRSYQLASTSDRW